MFTITSYRPGVSFQIFHLDQKYKRLIGSERLCKHWFKFHFKWFYNLRFHYAFQLCNQQQKSKQNFIRKHKITEVSERKQNIHPILWNNRLLLLYLKSEVGAFFSHYFKWIFIVDMANLFINIKSMYSFVENQTPFLWYTALGRLTRIVYRKQVFQSTQMHIQIYTHTFLFPNGFKLYYVAMELLQQFCYQTGLDYQATAEFTASWFYIPTIWACMSALA